MAQSLTIKVGETRTATVTALDAQSVDVTSTCGITPNVQDAAVLAASLSSGNNVFTITGLKVGVSTLNFTASNPAGTASSDADTFTVATQFSAPVTVTVVLA
jgi:hypothetical protein